MVAALVGCGGTDTSLGPSGNTTATVRAFNALVSSTTSADFAQRNQAAVLFHGVGYGQATGYTQDAAGNSLNDFIVQNGVAVTSGSGTLSPNNSYTLIAAGDASIASGGGINLGAQFLQIKDDPPSAASLNGNAAVRVVHVAPNVAVAYQTIDLYNAGLPLTGLTNISYGSATAYVSLPAMTYNLTIHSHASNSLLALPVGTTTSLSAITFTAGKSYTLFVIGSANEPALNEPFDVRVVTDD
jgi:hypothetical protein